MNGKQKRAHTMAQLTNKSKDYEKFTRELQFALEKEVIRRQNAIHSENEEKNGLVKSIE